MDKKMVKMKGHIIPICDGEIWGNKISEYGREHNRLDYHTLVKSMTCDNYILNNCIKFESQAKDFEWELVNGRDTYNPYEEDEDYDEEYEDYEEPIDFYQYFIIDNWGAENFKRYTDEPVYYCEELDIYLLAVSHVGTSWDYVLTEYEIENYEEE